MELQMENQWICTSLMRRYVSHLDAHAISLSLNAILYENLTVVSAEGMKNVHYFV